MPHSKKSKEHKRHADFAASASDKHLACPGSVFACRGLESEDSFASLEGTAAHELASASLLARVCPTKLRLKGKVEDQHHEFINDEMRLEIKKYFDFCVPYFDKGEVFIESKFDLSWLAPKKLVHWESVPKGDFAPKGKATMFGTGDFVCVEPFGDIHVIDLKFGKGKIVEAFENAQLAFYGLGAAASVAGWDFENAHLSIFQPRRDHFPTWQVSKVELETVWVEKFKGLIASAFAKEPAFTPGAHCGFCPLKESCPARAEGVKNELSTQFADVPVLAPKDLSPAQIAKVLTAGDLVEDWLASVRAEALKRLEADTASVPGFKLVEKRAQRQWKDVPTVAKFARDFGYADMFTEPELISPAQADKVLGKAKVAEFSVKVSSGVTLAKESDKRPALGSTIERDFKD